MKLYAAEEILPAGWSVERGHVVGGVPFVVIKNEYGREIVKLQDTPLTRADWQLVWKHLGDVAAAEAWMSSLRRLSGEAS